MDATGKIKKIKNIKGITLVVVALLIVVLVAFVGLGVDIGYMYVAKGQLQNAADAAALAGAANLDGTNSIIQANARNAAFILASSNKVVPSRTAVHIGHPIPSSDSDTGNNVLTSGNPGNDIVVGHWNGTRFSFNNTSSINAVQVRARRTEGSPGGQVNIFFSKILGWSQMSAVAQAISGQAVVPTSPIPFCINACNLYTGVFNPASPGPTHTFYWAPYPKELLPADQGTYGIAWTVLSETSQSTPTKDIIDLICGAKIDACNKVIYAANGSNNSAMRQLRCAFKDPNFDKNNKYFFTSGPHNGEVQYWTTTVPILEAAGCPPGNQPNPYRVVQYARVTISEVYASGNQKCNCTSDVPKLSGPLDNAIDVVFIQCVACDVALPGMSFLPVLRN
jgi:Flp pilus assembly protein TadG